MYKALVIACFVLAQLLSFPQSTTPLLDPLTQNVGSFVIKDETIGDALGRLNQLFDISISIEGVLPEEGTITNPKLSGTLENRTLAGVLDWLCDLDGRYTWARDDDNVNIFPRASLNDARYFFKQTIADLRFEHVRKVADAVLAVDRQSGDQQGGVIYMGFGQAQSFAQDWTASFEKLTVRQALNRIARRLGPTCGWQVGGTTKARLIVFHYKLEETHPHVGD
jgi:hypothetical protein